MSKFKTVEMTYASVQEKAHLLRQISDLSEQINLQNERHAAALEQYRRHHAQEMEALQEQLIGCERKNIELRKKLLKHGIEFNETEHSSR